MGFSELGFRRAWASGTYSMVVTAFLAVLGPLASAGADQTSTPWLSQTWDQNFSITPGHYAGPGTAITLVNQPTINWEPGSVVENLLIQGGDETKIRATRLLHRGGEIGLNVGGRFTAMDCAFDNVRMFKTGDGTAQNKCNTEWRFDNCVFSRKLFRTDNSAKDISVAARNCTFTEMKLPAFHYINNDAAGQAQTHWLKFERCHFINCELNENFLLMTVDCFFENCTYNGPQNWWGSRLLKPLKVRAWWSGSSVSSYQQDKLHVTFHSTRPLFRTGCTLPWRFETGVLTLASQSAMVAAPVTMLGSIKSLTPPPRTEKPAALTEFSVVTVTGTSGAAADPLRQAHSGINALLVVNLPGQGEAGVAAKLSALALPIAGETSAEVTFNQPVGPLMASALREVAKFLQIRHQGWPRGQRIELAFVERYSPKDGPSAAVGCALVLDSMFAGWTVDPGFAITGDLNADGSVQPIGGVAGKLRGAAKGLCTRLAIPLKNEVAVADLLVLEGPAALLKVEVYTVDTFASAQMLAKLPMDFDVAYVSTLFGEVQRAVLPGGVLQAGALTNPPVRERLQQILRMQPNHLSAKLLLAASESTGPKKLSLGGSVEAVDTAGAALMRAAKGRNEQSLRGIASDELGIAVGRLTTIRGKLDPRVHPTLDSLQEFGRLLRQLISRPPNGETRRRRVVAELIAAGAVADGEREKLATNREVLEELMQ